MTTNVTGIVRSVEKHTQQTALEYDGNARPGELVVDLTTYQLYVGNADGALNLVGGGGGGGAPGGTNTQIQFNDAGAFGGSAGLTYNSATGEMAVAGNIAAGNIDVTGTFTAANLVIAGSVTGNFIPAASNTYTLGNATNRWKDIYLSADSIFLGDSKISANTTAIALAPPSSGNVLSVSVTGTNVTGNVVATGSVTATAGAVTNIITGRTSGVSILATGTNQNITLVPSGFGNVDVTGTNINNLANPIQAQDAATKSYVDAAVSSLKLLAPAQAATSASLATLTGGTVTYDNGAAGVGATITLSVALTVLDGYVMQNTDRVLVKNETNQAYNGVYTWSTGGTVLLRASDFDTPAEVDAGAFLFVQYGVSYNNTSWVQLATTTSIGSSAILFTQFSGVGTYTAGTGLTLAGTQFSLTNTTVTAGSYGSSTAIPTFTVNQQGQLTAAATTPVIAPAGTLTGSTLAPTVVTSSLTTVGTLNTLSVSGVSNLNAVGNVTITGGAAGQVLTTNGAGALTWSTPAAGSLVNGTSNVLIPSVNGNVNTSVGGVANVLVVTATGANVAGTATVTGNVTGGNLTTAGKVSGGTLAVTGTSNLNAVGNVTITGGAAGQVLTTDGAGVLAWTTPAAGSLANGTSNVLIPVVNGNVNTSVGGAANVLVVTSIGANVAGTATVTGNITGGNLTTTGKVSSGTLAVTGVSNLNAVGNVTITGGVSGQYLQTNGSGVLAWSTVAVSGIANGTSNVLIPAVNGNVNTSVGGTANVLVVTSTGANVAGTATATGNVTGGNLVTAGKVSGGTLAVTGTSNLNAVGNVTITGGTSGQVLTTDGAGALTWSTVAVGGVANGTSNVAIPAINGNVNTSVGGVANVLVVTSAGANVAGTVTATGNVTGGNLTTAGKVSSGTLAVTGTSNLNAVGNVTITGGTSGQVLTTDGAGALTWSTVAVGGVANGTSNVLIPAVNGNVNTSVGGVANVLVVTSTGANILGTATATGNVTGGNLTTAGRVSGGTLAVTGTSNLNAVGNVTITGGASGQVLTTNGAGVLTWSTPAAGSLANGTSNVLIPAVNGNVNTSVGGTANVLVVTATGANITGTATATGNVTGANLTTAGRVSGGTLAVTGTSNLNAVGNVTITGGTSGQVLTTNGSGVLSWANVTAPASTRLANGTTELNVFANEIVMGINSSTATTRFGNVQTVLDGSALKVVGSPSKVAFYTPSRSGPLTVSYTQIIANLTTVYLQDFGDNVMFLPPAISGTQGYDINLTFSPTVTLAAATELNSITYFSFWARQTAGAVDQLNSFYIDGALVTTHNEYPLPTSLNTVMAQYEFQIIRSNEPKLGTWYVTRKRTQWTGIVPY